MKKIFCFGEVLLRYAPAADGSWLENASIPVFIGGAELNVATALSNWKMPVQYCTALPCNFLADEIEHFIMSKNIDCSPVQHFGNRLGTYYLQQGADLKNDNLIYDREHSSFSQLHRGMIDWESVLAEVSWFHFSAISPGLHENVAAVCLEALQAASKKNITISIDLNYRSRLWKYGKEPKDVMIPLLQYCDVVAGNIWAANELLGVKLLQQISSGDYGTSMSAAKQAADGICLLTGKKPIVANTFRFDTTGAGIAYHGSLHTSEQDYLSRQFATGSVINKIGSGDCFMAGLIYGLYNNHPLQQVLDFATAAAFGKLGEEGDATTQDVQTIMQRMNDHG